MVKRKVLYGPSGEDASHGDSVDAMHSAQSAGVPLEESPDPAVSGEGGDGPDWLRIARDSFEDSHRFVESSLRAQWERNQRAFQNRHPGGSKYFSDAYKHRTKLFRPKTRSVIRQGEAHAAAFPLGGKKRYKYLSFDVLRYSRAVVSYLDGDMAAFVQTC